MGCRIWIGLEDIKKILSWSVGDKTGEVVGKDEVSEKGTDEGKVSNDTAIKK